jgi:hypothetical protein
VITERRKRTQGGSRKGRGDGGLRGVKTAYKLQVLNKFVKGAAA